MFTEPLFCNIAPS